MNLAIIGGGSWGTALSIALAPRFEQARLWMFEADLAERVESKRENDAYLPGFRLPDNVGVGSSLSWAIENPDILIGVMPSQHARELYRAMVPYLNPSMTFVSATKGIEKGSLLRISEVASDILATKFPARIAVLSGPTFAREIAAGEPAAVAISSSDLDIARHVQAAFSSPFLRLYTNQDPVGVEVRAALKNVVAIAAGVCHGLGLGSNTKAALITRGLAEITRLAVAMGGQRETLAGLAGLGDLVLTCSGDLSRNRMVGIELSRGRGLAEILASTKMVAEGVETCDAAVALGQKFKVDLPIMEQMHAVLHQAKSPQAALRDLMERSLEGE